MPQPQWRCGTSGAITPIDNLTLTYNDVEETRLESFRDAENVKNCSCYVDAATEGPREGHEITKVELFCEELQVEEWDAWE